jgi:hypothetical protein
MAYFTFPLYLLAAQNEPKERMQFIVSYCLIEVGMKQHREMEERDLERFIEKWENKPDRKGFNRRRKDHIEKMIGCEILGVNPGSFNNGCPEKHAQAARFVEVVEGRFGPSPLVFVGSSLLWGCHNDDEPTWREFTVLCAINSCLGQKETPMRICREMIIPRALGYKTKEMMLGLLESRTDGSRPLTTQELRTTLDHLEDRGLIHRIQASRRWIYFRRTDAVGGHEEFAKQVQAIIEKFRRPRSRLNRERDRREFHVR